MNRSIVYTAAALLLFTSCTKQIKQEVPRNEYILKEEVSIGDEKDENSLFKGITDFAVDGQGDVYVLESRTKEVRVFNRNGKFIISFSKEGEGPGETLLPWCLTLDEKNEMVYIVDWRKKKISRYRSNGEFDSDLSLKNYSPIALFLDADGNYLVLCLIDKNDKNDSLSFFKIIKMTPKGNILKESNEFFNDRLQIIHEGDYAFTYYAPFRPTGFLYFKSGGDYFYHGVSDKYEINVLDKDFNPVKAIRKANAVPETVTDADKKEYVDAYLERGRRKKRLPLYKKISEQFKFPEKHPLFAGLWVDDKKRLLVNSFTKEDEVHIDVFNAEGVYIEKMVIHAPGGEIEFESIFDSKTVFKSGYIYATVYENDNLTIKKFRLEKWHAVKLATK